MLSETYKPNWKQSGNQNQPRRPLSRILGNESCRVKLATPPNKAFVFMNKMFWKHHPAEFPIIPPPLDQWPIPREGCQCSSSSSSTESAISVGSTAAAATTKLAQTHGAAGRDTCSSSWNTLHWLSLPEKPGLPAAVSGSAVGSPTLQRSLTRETVRQHTVLHLWVDVGSNTKDWTCWYTKCGFVYWFARS